MGEDVSLFVGSASVDRRNAVFGGCFLLLLKVQTTEEASFGLLTASLDVVLDFLVLLIEFGKVGLEILALEIGEKVDLGEVRWGNVTSDAA